MPDIYKTRLGSLATIVADSGLDAVALIPGANFTYVTGLHFHLMERPTIMFATKAGDVLAIMPELERQKWSQCFTDAQTFYWQDSDGFQDAFASAATALHGKKIGVEGMLMRVFEADAMRHHFGADNILDAQKYLTPLRHVKSPDEIAALQEAIRISEQALEETLLSVRAGQAELEILNILKIRMLANGAQGFSFDPIVLAGGNSANPHGTSGGTILRAGDPLLIDFGASYGGFHADITRTVFCEYVSDVHRAIYETVLAANRKGREIAGPTLSAHDLDVSVTLVLSDSPYGELIVHKTGHGLGLELHEAPQVMIGNHTQLLPGNVLTIEPGLYRPGDIGIRIEDNVCITDEGAHTLTRFPRGLRIVGL